MAIPPPQLGFLCDLIYRKSAIVLTPEKEYLIESRLAPVARAEGYHSIDAMVTALRSPSQSGLQRIVIEAMTTNETTFFRDFHPFEAVRDSLLPALRTARAASRTLNILSAACSTGQEAYSMAMLLDDPAVGLSSWNVRIIGGDLNEAVVARARDGLYNQSEMNRGLPGDLQSKYFTAVGSEWQINKSLRDRVEFMQMNLIEPWPTLPRIDLLFLRNVLIYFDIATKKAILDRARAVLAPDGYLILGGAETTINVDDKFDRIALGPTTVYKRIV